ncbi:SMP-30/gluconolactonase/LRE family protein [Saccharopolyspora erythraea]|uniref:SMP-30/gluconolactonase/LRE family protein n=1 Tax=Saccharopolyspora erythraea TaxID=1836 RepID=UPI0001D31426|nr:SMP-30/gluconolactonase/LRE family protein [Saccharopolyspora erythraea]EQD87214.1 calcium-binding protein [Saccharopolyspora erythraea D]QRK91098.1 SMP-30/gluconolactonase/LRE family protein [Saccharopolyspora erythraea]
MSAQAQPEVAVPAAARHGYAPVWDTGTDSLLWVDVPARTVHRMTVDRVDHSMEVPQAVSSARPRSRGGLVLHLAEGVALFDADGEHRVWLVYWARDGVRGGATAIDRKGRLWASTVREDESGDGWLARVTDDGAAKIALDGLAAACGVGWSPDDARMYFADSATGRVDVLDFDVAAGTATGRRPLCEVGGEPAGLCVDADGCVWVAVRDAAQIRRYTPEGELDRCVELPVRRPTDCCFGGPDLTDLYVTSARDGVSDPGDTDGAVLVVPGIGTGLRTPAFTG